MNLCRDCKHAKEHEVWNYWRCQHPQNDRGPNPVTGEPRTVFTYCEEMRGMNSPCGPTGAWFEPRTEIPTSIKKSPPAADLREAPLIERDCGSASPQRPDRQRGGDKEGL